MDRCGRFAADDFQVRQAPREKPVRAVPAPPAPTEQYKHHRSRNPCMSKELTPAQQEEIKALLLARRNELQGQMQQNRENLCASHGRRRRHRPTQRGARGGPGPVRHRYRRPGAYRARPEALGRWQLWPLGDECGCAIPFERLKIEPQTQHCVACKSRWEQARAHHRATAPLISRGARMAHSRAAVGSIVSVAPGPHDTPTLRQQSYRHCEPRPPPCATSLYKHALPSTMAP